MEWDEWMNETEIFNKIFEKGNSQSKVSSKIIIIVVE